MSTRLQVVMDDVELAEIESIATRQGVTLSEWVRQVLRAARREVSASPSARKLAAVRLAAGQQFPTADIDQMLAEIASGYGSSE